MGRGARTPGSGASVLRGGDGLESKAAEQLEVGDQIQLPDGDVLEVLDLQPAPSGGDPLGGVAVWLESEDSPVLLPRDEEMIVVPYEPPARPPADSPWGEPNSADEILPGVFMVSTPSHGGIMIPRHIGDRFLSPESQRVGAGFGYSPSSPWSSEWYVFKEDSDWVTAANDIERHFGRNIAADNVPRIAVVRPASEIMEGDKIFTEEGEMKVEKISDSPNGSRIFNGPGGQSYVASSREEMRVERLVALSEEERELERANRPLPDAGRRAAGRVDDLFKTSDIWQKGEAGVSVSSSKNAAGHWSVALEHDRVSEEELLREIEGMETEIGQMVTREGFVPKLESWSGPSSSGVRVTLLPGKPEKVPQRSVRRDGRWIPSKAESYDDRILELTGEGLSHHDAQDVADAEGWDR